MSDSTPEKVNKTKLLHTLKTEITDVKQALDVEKVQLEKLQKRLAQVGPALDAMKEGFNGELARLRDEVADESQILMKVVSWIRDKLDAKIDGKIETAREQWTGDAKTNLADADAKLRRDFNELLEEEKGKWEAKWEEGEQRRKTEVELLKEDFAKGIAEAKDQWQQERIQLETQIQTLHKENTAYLQNQFSTFEGASKLLVATEVDKAATEKALQTEEKLHGVQSAQSEKLRAEFQKSSDDFRELLKMDLALLRNDEKMLWERERQAIREEERKFRESVRATIVEEISRFQSDALSIISAAQEELAKKKAKGFIEEDANGETPNGNKEDELFAIGKELSEKQFKREKEIQTQKIKIQPDSVLRRLDDEDGFEVQQQRRDMEQKRTVDLREKEEIERRKEEKELRDREDDIKKERERLENLRKQLESDQKREKQEAAQRQKEEDQKKERERAEQLQRIEEERADKLQQLRRQHDEVTKKEKERQEEVRRNREEEERKIEGLKKQNQEDRERREKELTEAQHRREREQADRERDAEAKKEDEKRKKRERQEAEAQERLDKEREKEEKEIKARQEKEEQEQLKREKRERKFRERQEQDEREKLERDLEEQRLHEEEERELRDAEAREEEESKALERAREERENKKRLAHDKQEKEREEREKKEKEDREKEREKDRAEKERKRKEKRAQEEREEEEQEREKEREEKEKEKEKERKKKEKEQKEKEKERERESEKKKKEQEKEKEKEDDDDEDEDEDSQGQRLSHPRRPKRTVRLPSQISPQIPTRTTTDDTPSSTPATASPSVKPKAGSVSVLPAVVPGKVALKSTAKPSDEERAPPPKKEESRGESASGECDVSDPDVQNAWKEVRSDTSSTNWFILGYGSSKTILSLYGSGSGGVPEFQKNLKNEILYGYIRIPYGDNKQAKFVFVTYFPENISQIARARANPHKAIVDKFIKIYNIQIAATTPDEVDADIVMAKLRAAGGASYGAANATSPSQKTQPSSANSKKEDEKKEKEEAERKKQDETAKQRKKEEEEKEKEKQRKKEEEKKQEEDSKRKLKEKEDSFTTYVGAAATTAAAGGGSIGGKGKCVVCSKTVYLTEQIMADNKTYHKTCFRCAHCNNIIKLGNYAALNGKLYCKPHFKQLFASKGNYNEGFGKKKLTHEWAAAKDGDDDEEEEEEEEEKPKAPATTKAVAPAAAPTPSVAKSNASAAPQKKSDITNLYSSLVKEPKSTPAPTKQDNKAILKNNLFDSDEDEEDALFAKK